MGGGAEGGGGLEKEKERQTQTWNLLACFWFIDILDKLKEMYFLLDYLMNIINIHFKMNEECKEFINKKIKMKEF